MIVRAIKTAKLGINLMKYFVDGYFYFVISNLFLITIATNAIVLALKHHILFVL